MLKFNPFILLAVALLNMVNCLGQSKNTGPIISDFGAVFTVENPDFVLNTLKNYHAVFDVMASPESHTVLNPNIETAARFLNMHAQAGIPINQLKAALVIHSTASKDILSDSAYQARYGTENPNKKLIQAITAAGGQVILCGQSAASRGIARDELMPEVQLALSAMTALIQLQDEGYRLIKF
ncbi:DsrE family protein [Arenibacter sp. GZD96]|uniref:DsrE family protein n=1 Tax=Aurantibrevibacter litoralis TaxID=3106030 RepID=UPI002AFFEBD5|nr:DsrE family protein [Arenibacter sp. GZD-96]MEA1785264.1 DsrE family protein [Arenibacter sp. GZD-96]